MRFRIVCFWLSVACVISFATGCQSSKFNMQKLAFWKNNDKLDSEYIEPPSQKFTPERTAVAESASRLDQGEGPPVRPETASTNNESLDAFADEVNRSWEELAEKSQSTTEQAAKSVNRALVDTANVSMPPARQNSDDLKQPSTPRYISSGSSGLSNNSSSKFEPNKGSFSPLAPKASPAPSARYEQLAQSTMPTMPTMSPLQPSVTNTIGTGDFAPSSGSMLTQASPVPGQFNPNNATVSNGATGSQYESTPYKPFTSRNESASQNIMQASNATGENRLTQVSQIPVTLQLSGQGTYAPGSVRRPSPLQPENLTALPQTGGGSFMR